MTVSPADAVFNNVSATVSKEGMYIAPFIESASSFPETPQSFVSRAAYTSVIMTVSAVFSASVKSSKNDFSLE